jgi:hypothetical protein
MLTYSPVERKSRVSQAISGPFQTESQSAIEFDEFIEAIPN